MLGLFVCVYVWGWGWGWIGEPHLGIAQHDHPHQDHVDVDPQGFVVVNLIHLKEARGPISSQKKITKQLLLHHFQPTP